MIEEYDIAWAKYASKLEIVPVPLLCWDIFANYNNEINSYNAIQKEWKNKVNFRKIVHSEKREIIITNANHEIIFVTNGIYGMNGWNSFEVIGKSPKIFQGKLTSEKSKNNIRIAIKNHLPFKEVILNYRKDESTYLCEIEGHPKFNNKGEFTNYIAFERIAS
jgi:transcriptional regulator with PAS, ATPase and Fis domain